LKSQAGYAEAAVLVVKMSAIICRRILKYPTAPRVSSILDLTGHRRLAGIMEQRAFVRSITSIA